MADGDSIALQDLAGTETFSVDASGNATVAGTLTVTGASTLTGATTVTGDLTTAGVNYKSVTTVAMGDGAWALVTGAAGASETQLVGNIVFCDPESAGASEILTLPAEANSVGLELTIYNTGGEGIVINDDAAATVATLATAEHCIVACDGTTWYGFVGAET